MTQRTCTYCHAPCALGWEVPRRLAGGAPWAVYACDAHKDQAEAAWRTEMARRGLK